MEFEWRKHCITVCSSLTDDKILWFLLSTQYLCKKEVKGYIAKLKAKNIPAILVQPYTQKHDMNKITTVTYTHRAVMDWRTRRGSCSPRKRERKKIDRRLESLNTIKEDEEKMPAVERKTDSVWPTSHTPLLPIQQRIRFIIIQSLDLRNSLLLDILSIRLLISWFNVTIVSRDSRKWQMELKSSWGFIWPLYFHFLFDSRQFSQISIEKKTY
jgi:hypothetical protein